MAIDEERKNQLGLVAKLMRQGWKWRVKRWLLIDAMDGSARRAS